MAELFLQYKHLYHRTSFGLAPNQMMRPLTSSLSQVVDDLLEENEEREAPDLEEENLPTFDRRSFLSLSEQEKAMAREDDRAKLRQVRNDWLYRMAFSERTVLPLKLALFWHGHLACQCNTSVTAKSYLRTLEKHALGNVRQLVLAIAKEPAMLRFLNNQQNRKGHPNENFARELLELFTMGEGNYTEADVKESARAFTGWGINRQGRFMIRPAFHDFGQKRFLGHEGNLNGDDIIDIVFQQRTTAIFIASKLYRYFVNEKSNKEHIDLLAAKLYEADYEIKPTLRFLFRQPWFYAAANVGTKIKSPVDLIVQIVRLLGIKFRSPDALSFLQRGLGQLLFNPPNVAGWPGGKNWINNATLMLRLNMPIFLLDQSRFDHATATPLKAMQASKPIQTLHLDYDLAPLLEPFRGVPYEEIEQHMKDHLLAVEASPELMTNRDRRSGRPMAEIVLRRLLSLPEFQMC